jgi:hypothetical protein
VRAINMSDEPRSYCLCGRGDRPRMLLATVGGQPGLQVRWWRARCKRPLGDMSASATMRPTGELGFRSPLFALSAVAIVAPLSPLPRKDTSSQCNSSAFLFVTASYGSVLSSSLVKECTNS